MVNLPFSVERGTCNKFIVSSSNTLFWYYLARTINQHQYHLPWVIHITPVNQVVTGHKVDQAAFTLTESSLVTLSVYLEVKDYIRIAHQNNPLRIVEERLQQSKKGLSLTKRIWCINRNHPENETYLLLSIYNGLKILVSEHADCVC